MSDADELSLMPTRKPLLHQVAALPYLVERPGTTLVMLVTSLETHRWVIPKTRLKPQLPGSRLAARESYIAAGIFGLADADPLGRYHYEKRRQDGSTCVAAVMVYSVAFVAKATEWPERRYRERKWFTLNEAADAVSEPALKALIAGFELDTGHC